MNDLKNEAEPARAARVLEKDFFRSVATERFEADSMSTILVSSR